jgi:hypothetical protein
MRQRELPIDEKPRPYAGVSSFEGPSEAEVRCHVEDTRRAALLTTLHLVKSAGRRAQISCTIGPHVARFEFASAGTSLAIRAFPQAACCRLAKPETSAVEAPSSGPPILARESAGAGLERMYLGPERRINPRHRIVTAGVIWRKGHPRVECTVQDFSPAGAGVLLTDAVGLPEEFDLTFDRATRHCAVVWRHLDRVGVKFKSTRAAD